MHEHEHVVEFEDILPSPFAPNLSESELRETAYEMLVGACRSSGPKPLTFFSHSEQSNRGGTQRIPSPSLYRSLTVTASSRNGRAATTGELMRVQMKVTELTDTRLRRALLRVAAGQLIQQVKCSDFPSEQEYEAWLRRNLKVLEAGLILHPRLPLLDKADTCVLRLQQIIHEGLEKPMDIEVDEVFELIKTTWVMLAMNEMLHNVCFSWVLFQRYVANGQVDNDLLFASSNLLAQVENDAKAMNDPFISKSLSYALNLMLSWAEERLLAYHDTFHNGNIESMQSVVSLAKLEKLDPRISKHVPRQHDKVFSTLSVLARDISELAFNEKATFSPILKRWHPLAAGVAVATLHVCYGHELKQYVKSVTELTPDAVEMLIAADKLERTAVIINLVKSWIKTRMDGLEECVDRNLQEEVWNPRANKECFAPSVLEILGIIDDSLEAFFLLPIPMHAALLPELMSALDKSLQQYILKAKSGCGSKFHGVFRKKGKSQVTDQRRIFHHGTTNVDSSFALPQFCVRINTMQRIGMGLKVLEKRTISRLGNSKSTKEYGIEDKFKLSKAASVEGIRQLSEAMTYKVIFQDLRYVLWDGLYFGEVSSTRIEPFLEELNQCLKIILSTVHDRVITHVITEVMKASFDGFLLVLLAGGPAQGLPADLIEKQCTTVKEVLPLFRMDTEDLIELFSELILGMYGSSAKFHLPLPTTSGQWSPREPNTILRILCHRSDNTAAKFLKKNYNLPKKSNR
ncbi:hypothetical protein JHK82_020357 [Glycine max]|nr:hypothetical protein JHK85_020809 [Glycine max]KAG5024457.1 hypothetical protein JHK86_020371 [Glycine max]KAG5135626.1 hypothetical protein JHK82_020357 [Glycine max]